QISAFVLSARPRNTSCDICPSFSSSVILASNASIFRSVSAGVAARRQSDPAASNATSSAACPCRTGTFQDLLIEEDIYLFLCLRSYCLKSSKFGEQHGVCTGLRIIISVRV